MKKLCRDQVCHGWTEIVFNRVVCVATMIDVAFKLLALGKLIHIPSV